MLTVPDTVILSARSGTSYQRVAYVVELAATFEWVPGSTAAVDNVTVIGHTGGTVGRWLVLDAGNRVKVPSTNVEEIRYMRPGGSVSYDGETVETAWPDTADGLKRWINSLKTVGGELRQILDVTGSNLVVEESFSVGEHLLGKINHSFQLAGVTSPTNYYSVAPFQMRATPAEVMTVTVTSSVADADSGLYTATVSETLVASAHKRRFLLGAAAGEWAPIHDNGVNTIKVASTSYNPATFTAPVKIYTPGADFTFGDPNELIDVHAFMVDSHGTWCFSGIAFHSTEVTKPSVTSRGPGAVYFQLCTFDGFDHSQAGWTIMDASCVTTSFHGNIGCGPLMCRNCVFSDLGASYFHANVGSGSTDFIECIISNHLLPWGGGIAQPSFTMVLLNCEIKNGASHGLSAGRAYVRLANCLVKDNAAAGIYANGFCTLTLNNVGGTGNGTYGLDIHDGAQCKAHNGTDMTGTSGDVNLGGAGVKTWASTPQTDVIELVRFHA